MREPAAPNSLSRPRERAGVRVARELRTHATDAEALLWRHLRARQLADLKFRRQHPLGGYVLDFACLEARLVVEVDGGQHAESSAAARDARRTQLIAAQGLRVLRFWNHEVLSNIDGVLQAIVHAATQPSPHPSPQPSPASGRGSEQKDQP
jgi:very-short-patch-repair endonuclease